MEMKKEVLSEQSPVSLSLALAGCAAAISVSLYLLIPLNNLRQRAELLRETQLSILVKLEEIKKNMAEEFATKDQVRGWILLLRAENKAKEGEPTRVAVPDFPWTK